MWSFTSWSACTCVCFAREGWQHTAGIDTVLLQYRLLKLLHSVLLPVPCMLHSTQHAAHSTQHAAPAIMMSSTQGLPTFAFTCCRSCRNLLKHAYQMLFDSGCCYAALQEGVG